MLLAVGRRPYTDGLGLDLAGVKTDERGYIAVDSAAGRRSVASCCRWRPATCGRPPSAVTADRACTCAPAYKCASGLRPTRYGAGDWPPGDIRPAARRVEANALVPSHRHRSCASRLAPSTRISRD